MRSVFLKSAVVGVVAVSLGLFASCGGRIECSGCEVEGKASQAAGAGAPTDGAGAPAERPNERLMGLLGSLSVQSAPSQHRGAAAFWEHPLDGDGAPVLPGQATACSSFEEGPCRVTQCPADAGVPGSAVEPPSLLSAGLVSVAGGFAVVKLSPLPEGGYVSDLGTGPLFEGGETLTFFAEGGQFPAFQANLVAPPTLTVQSPTVSPEGDVTWVPGEDLPLTWTGQGQGTLFVSLFAEASSTRTQASCAFEPSAGQGRIPASVFERLGSDTATLGARVANPSLQAVAGGWVQLEAETPVLQSGGLPFAATLRR